MQYAACHGRKKGASSQLHRVPFARMEIVQRWHGIALNDNNVDILIKIPFAKNFFFCFFSLSLHSCHSSFLCKVCHHRRAPWKESSRWVQCPGEHYWYCGGRRKMYWFYCGDEVKLSWQRPMIYPHSQRYRLLFLGWQCFDVDYVGVGDVLAQRLFGRSHLHATIVRCVCVCALCLHWNSRDVEDFAHDKYPAYNGGLWYIIYVGVGNRREEKKKKKRRQDLYFSYLQSRFRCFWRVSERGHVCRWLVTVFGAKVAAAAKNGGNDVTDNNVTQHTHTLTRSFISLFIVTGEKHGQFHFCIKWNGEKQNAEGAFTMLWMWTVAAVAVWRRYRPLPEPRAPCRQSLRTKQKRV